MSRLPHLYPEGKWLFVTWHLAACLPKNLYPPPSAKNAGRAFVWMDRYLDTTRTGPMYLRQEEIANVVESALRQESGYQLDAYVLMPNHVHALLLPQGPVPALLGKLKGASARLANQLLGRTGKAFWQRESYDHWVRDGAELDRIRGYIENNPVKAGLAAQPAEYRWSSAHWNCGARFSVHRGFSPVGVDRTLN